MNIFRRVLKRIWRKRGLGCLPNPPDPRDFRFVPRKGVSLPSEASLEQYCKVVDQGRTGSCVGNAVAGAVHIMEQKSGKQYDYPSRLFLYWISRRRHDNPPLKDDGTYIRTCCKALTKLGVPDETVWPFKPSLVNAKPKGFLPWTKADPRKNGEYLMITESGAARAKRIKQAIDAGYPVVFGTSVAQSFMSAVGDDTIDKPGEKDKLVGGHAMAIVGYRTLPNGHTLFRVINSWGKRWRDRGFCWFTEDYIRWVKSSDFTVIHGWKAVL